MPLSGGMVKQGCAVISPLTHALMWLPISSGSGSAASAVLGITEPG